MAAMSNEAQTLQQIQDWGQVGHLDTLQQASLTQFLQHAARDKLDAVKYTCETLEHVSLRYLRARRFDVPLSLQLLSDSVRVRQEHGAERYKNATPNECLGCDEDLLPYIYSNQYNGFDKMNRPILFELAGVADIYATGIMTSKDNLVKLHWRTMQHQLDELFAAATQREGPAVMAICSVIDLDGLTSKAMTSGVLDLLKAFTAIDNVCYPEMLGKMFIINAPKIFVGFWEIIKRWLDPRTCAKIELLSTPDTWRDKLFAVIGEDNLPENFGGSRPPLKAGSLSGFAELLNVPRRGESVKTVTLPVDPCGVGQEGEPATLRVELFSNGDPFNISILCVTNDNSVIPLLPSFDILPNPATPEAKIHFSQEFGIDRSTLTVNKAIIRMIVRNSAKILSKDCVVCMRVTSNLDAQASGGALVADSPGSVTGDSGDAVASAAGEEKEAIHT